METEAEKNKYKAKGIELFFSLSGWLVAPLVLAFFLGKWLDAKFDTDPVLFLVCLGLGFLSTCFGIAKEARNFIKEIEKETKK